MPIKSRDIDIEGIDVSTPEDDDYCPATRGGCWICNRLVEQGEDKGFSREFDTRYHKSCLDQAGCDTILEFEKKMVPNGGEDS